MSFVVGCRLPNNTVSALRPISAQFVFLGGPGQSLDAALSGWTCAAAHVTVWTVAVCPTTRNLVPLLNDHRGDFLLLLVFIRDVLCGVVAVALVFCIREYGFRLNLVLLGQNVRLFCRTCCGPCMSNFSPFTEDASLL